MVHLKHPQLLDPCARQEGEHGSALKRLRGLIVRGSKSTNRNSPGRIDFRTVWRCQRCSSWPSCRATRTGCACSPGALRAGSRMHALREAARARARQRPQHARRADDRRPCDRARAVQVWCVAWSASGKRLASCGGDKAVRSAQPDARMRPCACAAPCRGRDERPPPGSMPRRVCASPLQERPLRRT